MKKKKKVEETKQEKKWISREEWWDLFRQAKSYQDLTNVVMHYDCPSAYKDLELNKEVEDGKQND